MPQCFTHDHAYIFQNPDGRILFAIPYEGRFTLIGTTDVEHRGPIGHVRISEDEIAYLCAQASRYFTQPVTPGDVSGPMPACAPCSTTSTATRPR